MIFKDFIIVDNQVRLGKANQPRTKFAKKMLRTISNKRMPTNQNGPLFTRIHIKAYQLLGNPSSLTRDLGNAYLAARPLR